MGLETALAIGAGANVLGGILGYGEQRAARKRQENLGNQAQGLTQGPNQVDQLIMSQLSKPNTGQDGFLQMLRSNPNTLKPYMFNYSQAFQDLQSRDKFVLQDQLAGLRSSAGSLGERFGSGFAAKEGMLRARYGADISARNAGIAQNSFNTALQYGSQGYAMGQSQNNQLLQLLLSSQQGRTGQQLAALGIAGQPLPGTAGTIAQGGTDLAQLLVLGNYLRGSGGGGVFSETPVGSWSKPVSASTAGPFWG